MTVGDGLGTGIRGDYVRVEFALCHVFESRLVTLAIKILHFLIQKMNLDEMVDDAEYYLEDGYQRKPQALILVPTREIAIQVSDDINKLLPKQLKCVSLYSDPQ